VAIHSSASHAEEGIACFLGSQKYTEVDLATQEAENPKLKSEKLPYGFFWVLSKESKAKREEFSGQFLGTFQQVEA